MIASALQTQQSGVSENPALNGTVLDVEVVSAQTQKPLIYPKDKYVTETGKFFDKLKQDGQVLYFVTLTYKSSRVPINTQLHHFYTRLLRHTVHPHNYPRPKYRSLQPTVLAWVDVPVSKRKTHSQPPRKSATDSLHHHAIFAVPNSIAGKFDALVDRISDPEFIKESFPFIKTIDVQTIGPREGLTEYQSLEKVIDYGSFYTRTRQRSQDDLFVILPISENERASK